MHSASDVTGTVCMCAKQTRRRQSSIRENQLVARETSNSHTPPPLIFFWEWCVSS